MMLAPLLHMVTDPSVPAFGDPVSFTVTVAVAFVHGATPVTVYTYAPGFIVAGSYMPPTTALGPLQVPPAWGVPPVASATAAELLHTVNVASVPALVAAFSVTVTVDASLTHGAVAAKV